MLEVESGLVSQKEEFASKMETLAQRRVDLQRKEGSLKESLTKFDKFLKENDAKRARAIKKAFDEKKLRELKDHEIERLKEAVERLGRQRERQVRAVENNLIFQHYLESILETTDEFGEIKDVIARFDTLAATNAELVERARVAQEKNEAVRGEFARAAETKNTVILNHNNHLASLQRRLEDAQARSSMLQAALDEQARAAKGKSLLVGQIKMATTNLFSLVRAHLQNRIPPSSDTFDQLDKIAQFVVDLQVVIEVLARQKEREKGFAEGGTGEGEATVGVGVSAGPGGDAA
ncbi:hypothetical protein M427DRAFT_115025 [Gonapodya prolifera JEL478]|uniref:DUF4200 domain-containing protein n=1 Tax=Gonapodya prolifera (strain JEL478) TaxID=1344416 RepID=A0A139A3I9_GONPJ|nr:hypothetical protein M427DRAFT_115025 [Gonapodya prolifera JEL478]|eukprot:KXS11341.1 hypothetical protein M427DRAFT_115025 [Gonapodya prolifera JEL478]